MYSCNRVARLAGIIHLRASVRIAHSASLTNREETDARPAARNSDHQFQSFPARAHGHSGAGGPRRRRDRDRSAGGGLAAPLEQRRHLARRPGHAALVQQPQQTQRGARFEGAQGQSDRAQAHRRRRRGGREFPPGCHGQARLRLRRLAAAQAVLDLCVGVRLRTRRSLCAAARSGFAGAGAVRGHGDHRAAGDRPSSGRRVRGRPPRRGAVRDGNPCRAGAPRAHGQGLPRRRKPYAGGARPAGGIAGGLAQCGEPAGDRERAPAYRRLVLPRAVRRLCHAQRPRRRLALPVASARRHHRGAAAGLVLRQGCLDPAGRDRRVDRRAAQDENHRGLEPSHGARANLARARAGLCRPRTRSAGQAHAGVGDG